MAPFSFLIKQMITVTLLLLGLCFGSFVNALVWRLYKQSTGGKQKKGQFSITKGRSACVNCGHKLSTLDLIPLVSWLFLRGRCRYCNKKISAQYPVVEASTALLFLVSYFFWPDEIIGWEVATFTIWLLCLIGFMALIVYDLRWMLLPNKIIFTLYGFAGLFVISSALSASSYKPILEAFIGILIGGGIFYLLFIISSGKWIGGGDVKLGFLLGALVGGPAPALIALFTASLLGTATSVPLILFGKAKRSTRIPFGPFLIAGAIIAQLFSEPLTSWYISTFIGV